ncbi:hypothetical protein SAMN05660284_02834 [Formivibrio citricus]|uniref:ATPase AAA-type core domain-containing protein n=1 Tax=Formivibrio citricus TaxID=83765 RepID=A0A1I5E455_9NEIS|nr:hypothetical protein [Formivibrio citricus]SFO06278.1 hypothetical protein SAMN05660284_02834 [Formivibrio citricus]
MDSKLRIHRIKFSNFHTFLDATEISFSLDRETGEVCGGVVSSVLDGAYLSPVITVAGSERGRANSTKPLTLAAGFISGKRLESFGNGMSFRTHPFAAKKSGSIAIEFELNDFLYRYVVEFNGIRVVFESLQVKTSKFFSCVFEKDARRSAIHYDLKTKNFGVTEVALRTAQSGYSIIANAAALGSSLAQSIVSAFSGIARCRDFSAPADILPSDVLAAADVFSGNERLRRQMASFISGMDEKLDDVVLEKHQYFFNDGSVSEKHIPYCVRRMPGESDKSRIQPLWNEHRDVLIMFVQLARVLPVLHRGGLIIMDRLDEGGGEEYLPSFVELFLHRDTNPHGAQLLFTANSLDVLKCVHASQIYLVRGGHYQRSYQHNAGALAA